MIKSKQNHNLPYLIQTIFSINLHNRIIMQNCFLNRYYGIFGTLYICYRDSLKMYKEVVVNGEKK